MSEVLTVYHTTASTVLYWFICLCRLYRSLGDYDVVRGIFSGKIGTKSVTFTALQAEAKSDYAEAVKLYNEVLMCVLFVTNTLWEHKRVPCFPLKWFCAAVVATHSVSVFLFLFYDRWKPVQYWINTIWIYGYRQYCYFWTQLLENSNLWIFNIYAVLVVFLFLHIRTCIWISVNTNIFLKKNENWAFTQRTV